MDLRQERARESTSKAGLQRRCPRPWQMSRGDCAGDCAIKSRRVYKGSGFDSHFTHTLISKPPASVLVIAVTVRANRNSTPLSAAFSAWPKSGGGVNTEGSEAK